MKTFSIITPAYISSQQKADELLRCVESIKKQKYSHKLIEHIIINDGSPFAFKLPEYSWLKVITQENLQRITAYNKGFEEAKNEVFWMLDSDDELVSQACRVINDAYRKFPKYKMFNFGWECRHWDGAITIREPFKPKIEKVGHEVFGGGQIANGSFVFLKEIYEELGAFMPPVIDEIDCTELNYDHHGEMVRHLLATSPYDFSAWFQLKHPEIREFFTVKMGEPLSKIIKELGNPYGQDFALFYEYTRIYHCKPIDEYLEIVHLKK